MFLGLGIKGRAVIGSAILEGWRGRVLGHTSIDTLGGGGKAWTCFWCVAIDGHLARGTTAHPKAREFGPAQARHGPSFTVLGLARPIERARAWAATRHAGRHGPARNF
jgi:hypothetical protein